MHFHNFILCLCILGTVVSAAVDETTRIGRKVKIGKHVTIKAHAEIGDYASIGSYSLIEENAHVGNYSKIRRCCSLGKGVEVSNYVEIDSYTVIKDGAKIETHSAIGQNSSIAQNVIIGKHATVGEKNRIESGSVIQKHCSTGRKVKIENAMIEKYAEIGKKSEIKSKAFIGKYSVIQSNVIVGESAVIHKYAEIPKDSNVDAMEVVIRTPSSYDLYRNCDLNVSSDSVSPEFNKQVSELIDIEMDALNTSCVKPGVKISPASLPKIISLYLIQYHGFERFKIYANVIQGRRQESDIPNELKSDIINYESLKRCLKKELHFGPEADDNLLEAFVTDKLIRLIALDFDAERENRIEGDTFCTMVEQLRNKTRKVTCSKRNYKSKRCNKS